MSEIGTCGGTRTRAGSLSNSLRAQICRQEDVLEAIVFVGTLLIVSDSLIAVMSCFRERALSAFDHPIEDIYLKPPRMRFARTIERILLR